MISFQIVFAIFIAVLICIYFRKFNFYSLVAMFCALITVAGVTLIDLQISVPITSPSGSLILATLLSAILFGTPVLGIVGTIKALTRAQYSKDRAWPVVITVLLTLFIVFILLAGVYATGG